MHRSRRAASRADCAAGINNAMSRLMMAITTSTSISVNPRRWGKPSTRARGDLVVVRGVIVGLGRGRRGIGGGDDPIAEAEHAGGGDDPGPRRVELARRRGARLGQVCQVGRGRGRDGHQRHPARRALVAPPPGSRLVGRQGGAARGATAAEEDHEPVAPVEPVGRFDPV